jgi:hypothetical protein
MERGLVFTLGLVVGIVGALGFYAWRLDDDVHLEAPTTDFPAISHDSEAAAVFLLDWERWRTATFVSEGTWTRRLDGVDEPLTGSHYTAQDPPRRLVVRLGATIEQVDNQIATCNSSNEEIVAPVCVAGTGMSYDQRVSVEMALVRGYVTGESREYDVRLGENGCYQLEIVQPRLASPWGKWSEFCFDAESGALRRAKVRRQSATDVELIISISTDVSDADFG